MIGTELERELETHFSDSYRRIWVQSTRLGSVCVTLFPIVQHQSYRIITQQKFGEITLETIKDLIMRNP